MEFLGEFKESATMLLDIAELDMETLPVRKLASGSAESVLSQPAPALFPFLPFCPPFPRPLAGATTLTEG